jgi:hypothetical protein
MMQDWADRLDQWELDGYQGEAHVPDGTGNEPEAAAHKGSATAPSEEPVVTPDAAVERHEEANVVVPLMSIVVDLHRKLTRDLH